jgi:5-methylcytosine-specific restriction endonuclease McrA
MTPSILALDVAGTPRKWINAEAAICYHAKSLVVWSLGEDVILYRGGISRMTGNQSIITSPSIIAIKGTDFNPTKFAKISLNNKALFARDRNMCAYCGQMHEGLKLSRDHIIPISRGGQNKWMNCVTACKRCNTLKNDRTLDEAGMELLYLPYIPVHNEYLILQNRNCLADQMDYLMAGLPKHSRVFEMMKDRKAA